jgi:hypothetical protein
MLLIVFIFKRIKLPQRSKVFQLQSFPNEA